MKKIMLIFLGVVLVGLLADPVMSAENGVGVIGPTVDDIDVELGRLKPDETIPLARAFTIAEARVNRLHHVGGFAGLAIVPTAFLELSVVLIAGGNSTNFVPFLQSTNPVARAMGVVCLSLTDTNAFNGPLRQLKDDKTELTVWTGCCMPVRMTLGELVVGLCQSPNFLGHQDDYGHFQDFRKQVSGGLVPVRVLQIR